MIHPAAGMLWWFVVAAPAVVLFGQIVCALRRVHTTLEGVFRGN